MRVKGWFVVIGRRGESDVDLFFFQYKLFWVWSGFGGWMHWAVTLVLFFVLIFLGGSWFIGLRWLLELWMHVY